MVRVPIFGFRLGLRLRLEYSVWFRVEVSVSFSAENGPRISNCGRLCIKHLSRAEFSQIIAVLVHAVL